MRYYSINSGLNTFLHVRGVFFAHQRLAVGQAMVPAALNYHAGEDISRHALIISLVSFLFPHFHLVLTHNKNTTSGCMAFWRSEVSPSSNVLCLPTWRFDMASLCHSRSITRLFTISLWFALILLLMDVRSG